MKTFNVEEYLKNPSRKVVTKEGKTVKRILCTDARGVYPIVALVDCGSYDNAIAYTKEGGFYANNEPSMNDLFFAPEKHEGYVNIYKNLMTGGMYCDCNIYASKEDAEKQHSIAIAKVEWEE